MAAVTTTLDANLSFDKKDLEAAIDRGREQIEAATNGGLAKMSWPLVKKRLAEAVGEEIDRNGISWFFGAWRFAKTLQSYKNKDKYPPDKQLFLKLGEHELSGTLEPCFTIHFEGAQVAEVKFETEVIAAFNAVTLAIRDGHITGFGGGDCALSVQLRCLGQNIGDRLKLKEFALPGEHSFDAPGIAIP